MFLQVDNRELATILAALRYYQRTGVCLDARNGDLIIPEEERDVATDGGTLEPLDENEIDELCERVNCEPSALVDQLVAALERASAACDSEGNDYDWAGEVENVLDAAYAAGLGPKVSAPLKRLLMAEIDNVEGDDPATLETVKDSLDSGYRPYDKFPVGKVKKELADLIGRIGGTVTAKRLVTTADWESRRKV